MFDINVSFIQSCVALKHGCTPANAVSTLRIPVVLNLAGYVIGALLLAPISDRIGRRNMLLFTMLLTGLGSLYNALAPDYTQFVLARVITGIGVGADLAIVNTYVGEVAPRRNRARWISVIFIMSALGALLGIWLGLFLTTPPAPWPHGLSFAQASPSFSNGWRWMYAVGALLAARRRRCCGWSCPSPPRWLVGQGRLDEADKVVTDMETRRRQARAARRRSRRRPVDQTHPEAARLSDALFNNRMYIRARDPAARRVVPGLRDRVRLLGRLHLDADLAQVPAARGRADHCGRRVRLPGLRAVRGRLRRSAGAQALAADRRGDHA